MNHANDNYNGTTPYCEGGYFNITPRVARNIAQHLDSGRGAARSLVGGSPRPARPPFPNSPTLHPAAISTSADAA